MKRMRHIHVGLFTLLTGVCAAGANDGYTAPVLEGSIAWKAVGAVAICVIGVVFVALKDSRRTQQSEP